MIFSIENGVTRKFNARILEDFINSSPILDVILEVEVVYGEGLPQLGVFDRFGQRKSCKRCEYANAMQYRQIDRTDNVQNIVTII